MNLNYDSISIICDNLSQIEICKLASVCRDFYDLLSRYLESKHTKKPLSKGTGIAHYFRGSKGYLGVGEYNIKSKRIYFYNNNKRINIGYCGSYRVYSVSFVHSQLDLYILERNHRFTVKLDMDKYTWSDYVIFMEKIKWMLEESRYI